MNLQQRIEAILFISTRPLSVKRLAGILESSDEEVQQALALLTAAYQERHGGVSIISHDGEVQMVTASEAAADVQKFLKDETTGELTKPSLETLTIIAYRGPITKSDLERIRGVNCSIILRNLLMRGLVEQQDDAKRLTTRYSVSMDFVKFLGLTSIQELPDYIKLHEAEAIDQYLAQQNETAASV